MKFILLSCLTFMIGFSTLLAGTYSGGSGTEVDPYQIANLNDLQEINQSTADWNSYFIQTADINASATATWDDGNGGSPEGFLPIANALDRFSGNYNGNDHIIDALTINRGTSDYAALFAYTNGSTISNLGLTNISVTGKMNIGALAGYNDNYSIIENCYSTGTVTASGYYCGGLVGYNIKYSEINNSYSSCTVNGSVNAGGITAYNHDHASINSSYFTGTVTGTNYVGGIIGSSASSSSINNCYTICEVVGEIFVGGFIGHNNTGTIDKCYSAGTISGDAAMGGFAGNNSGTISNSFWDTQTSGTNNGIAMGTNVGTLGLTTANMKLSSSYTPNGWDFTSIWAIESGANDNYPYLIDNPSSDVPLPITLAYFTATAINGVIELTWETATETNNARFVIYRNGIAIGTVDGAGTTSEPHNYCFVDNSVIPGVTYAYILADMDLGNNETRYNNDAVTITLASDLIEADFVIEAAYPNPFNPRTVITMHYEAGSNTVINIYNTQGILVDQLINDFVEAGHHEITWNASNMPSGVYVIIVQADKFVNSQKIILMK